MLLPLALAGLVACIQPALAAGLYADPAAAVQSMSASYQWLANGQAWAYHIYASLLVFELIALGVTTLLFRENLGEFLSSIGLKIFIGSVFMWFVANAGTWAPAVIAMFAQFGVQLGGTTSPDGVVSASLAAAAAIYTAGAAAVTSDNATANAIPVCVWGAGSGACPFAFIATAASQHQIFAMLSQAVALMLMLSSAVIILQFTLITIESCIVMGAGVLFIGFAGSRFTLPFSQGYFSYMINVGVKLLALYIMLGIETQLLPNVLLGAAGTVVAACCIPFGAGGSLIAIGVAAWVAFQVLIGAALIAAVPGIAASLLSGQSTVSGSQAATAALATLGAAQQLAGQLHASSAAMRQDQRLADVDGRITASPSAGMSRAPDSSPTSAATSAVSFEPAERGGAPSSSFVPQNGTSQAALANTSALATPNGSPRGLNSFTDDEVARMSDPQIMNHLRGTDFSGLTDTALDRLSASGTPVKAAAASEIQEQRGDVQMRGEIARGYGVSSLAGAVPREYAAPAAVQIRLSNPDKL